MTLILPEFKWVVRCSDPNYLRGSLDAISTQLLSSYGSWGQKPKKQAKETTRFRYNLSIVTLSIIGPLRQNGIASRETMDMQLLRAMVFMKVGFHSTESLAAILDRKRQEQQEAGTMFWGYGGTLCHPTKVVRPFIDAHLTDQLVIPLVMVVTTSRFEVEPTVAESFSEDGVVWQPMPTGIKVTGSRYAFVLRDLRPCDVELDLSGYVVGLGPSEGKPFNQYIRGRVDKGVARLSSCTQEVGSATVRMSYVGDLVKPYAVLLR